jgi:alpha 1,2-mannosyltransferase
LDYSRFNRKYQYPYVFLNDQPFNDDFKSSIKALTTAKVTFGDINQDMWSYPDFVDESVATEQLADYQSRGVMYGTVAQTYMLL